MGKDIPEPADLTDDDMHMCDRCGVTVRPPGTLTECEGEQVCAECLRDAGVELSASKAPVAAKVAQALKSRAALPYGGF